MSGSATTTIGHLGQEPLSSATLDRIAALLDHHAPLTQAECERVAFALECSAHCNPAVDSAERQRRCLALAERLRAY